MSVEEIQQNKELMRRFIEEVWNRGNLDVADELFDPQATTPDAPELPAGSEGAKVIARMFRSAFPDFHMTIQDLIAEDDKVAGRLTQSGTHQGTFMGAAATGRQVQFTEIAILRIARGRVVESWFQPDMLGLYRQLGLIPQTV
jgi:predicted ester cyclase